jgi:hypothetical protein
MWSWPLLYHPSKGVPVDTQAHDNIVDLLGFGEADRLTDQAFDARPQGQMLALDVLRVTFARHVLFRSEVTRVGAPMIGVEAFDAKGLEQCFEFQNDLVFATTTDIRQDSPRVMINRVPQSTRMVCLANNTPYVIHLGFASWRHVHGHLIRVYAAQHSPRHNILYSGAE